MAHSGPTEKNKSLEELIDAGFENKETAALQPGSQYQWRDPSAKLMCKIRLHPLVHGGGSFTPLKIGSSMHAGRPQLGQAQLAVQMLVSRSRIGAQSMVQS